MPPIRYTLTAEDFVAAHRLWQSAQLRGRYLLVLAVMIAGFIVLIDQTGEGPARSGFVGGLASTILVPFYLIWNLPQRALKVFRQQKAAQYEVTLSWDDEALALVTAISTLRLPWSLFSSWIDGPTTLALMQSDLSFNPIPKRVLPPEAARAIVGHLRRAKVPELRRFRLRW